MIKKPIIDDKKELKIIVKKTLLYDELVNKTNDYIERPLTKETKRLLKEEIFQIVMNYINDDIN